MDAVYSGIDLHSTNSVVAVIGSTGQLLYRVPLGRRFVRIGFQVSTFGTCGRASTVRIRRWSAAVVLGATAAPARWSQGTVMLRLSNWFADQPDVGATGLLASPNPIPARPVP